MNDIFISYQNKDRKYARALAEMLARHGYDVWWDINLLPGQVFANEINSIIGKSKATIVLWSENSISSDWVKSESSLALEKNILIPIQIENVSLPAPFNVLHTLNLNEWGGDHSSQILKSVLLPPLQDLIGKKEKTTLSSDEINSLLSKSAEEVEFWIDISNHKPQLVTEYEAYLEKYSVNGNFVELANIRILNLLKKKRLRRLIIISITISILIIFFVKLLCNFFCSKSPCPDEQFVMDDSINIDNESHKIEKGKYITGEINNEHGNHKKYVSIQSFYIDKFEVTNQQMKKYISDWTYPDNHEYYPATYVSWETARSYCLNIGKDLPTEIEWQIACRYGDNISKKSSSCRLTQVGTYTKGETPSIFNLYNNISEWTRDTATFQESDAQVNKIVKGGSYLDTELTCLDNLNYNMNTEAEEVGFRCIKYLDSTTQIK